MKKAKLRGLTDKQLIAAFDSINAVLNNHAMIINQHTKKLIALASPQLEGSASTQTALPRPEPTPADPSDFFREGSR